MTLTESMHEALSNVDEVLFACDPANDQLRPKLKVRLLATYAELARCYLELRAPSKYALSNIGGTGLSLKDYDDIELLQDLAALRRECLK